LKKKKAMLLENRSHFASADMDEIAVANDPPVLEMPAGSPQDLDDVFFSTNEDHAFDPSDVGERALPAGDDVSDMARLRSTHNTAGYREGVSASKEAHVQDGFDEGYSLGAEIGTRVGWILGALEGLVAGSRRATTTAIHQTATPQSSAQKDSDAESKGSHTEKNPTDVRTLLAQARLDLSAKNIYSQEYFHENGLWKYDVPVADPGDEDTNVIFRDVADAHPLILKWNGAVDTSASILGARLDSLKDSENSI
jgi:hypothetical protein